MNSCVPCSGIETVDKFLQRQGCMSHMVSGNKAEELDGDFAEGQEEVPSKGIGSRVGGEQLSILFNPQLNDDHGPAARWSRQT